MEHPSILGVLALTLLQALDVNGRSDLRSLFVLRETETVGLPACDHNSCKRIDIDYVALFGDEALSVRFGQSDFVFHVSDNTPSGSNGRTRMLTLKEVLYCHLSFSINPTQSIGCFRPTMPPLQACSSYGTE